ncbi:MAG TPA: HlyD family secretion protein, partial [Enhygromyxa sp.]|nr:HlyD family secretion protein [Enhygromyxa sp.]
GEPIATVIPPGELRIVAYFPARGAHGRIRAGQRATLRLDAYPWTQYGVVTGEVARVGSEPSEDRLRVEVRLDAAQPEALVLEHGLGGSLEVVVERVTPLTLLLRAVGTMVGERSS